MATEAFIDNDVFNKLGFVNEIWTQFLPQVGEERSTHRVQDTGAVIHGEEVRSRF